MGFGSFFTGKRKTVEEMLAALSQLGVRLGPGKTEADVTGEWSREQIEKGGFEMMLVAMGGEQVDTTTFESKGFVSDDVWHFDFECIEDHGDYARIVRRACEISGGELSIEPVSDFVDIEAGEAWIEWVAGGKAKRHPLTIDNDWADPTIFSLLADELAAAGSKKRFARHDLGQDCLIVCCAPDRLQALNKLTGLRFRETA